LWHGRGRRKGFVIETALVVPVPEAEPSVGTWRLQYASDAADGMWAHTTLIYPFRDSARIDAETMRDIGSVLTSFVSFTFMLTTVEYFRRPRVVLYLAPEPASPFQELTRALARMFPDAPPYRGVFDEIIPHVQIADEDDPEIFAAIEADVGSRLPIKAIAREVELVEHAPQGWSRRQSFRLANSA
jgi:2'-5' RNA ligase superfamily